MSNMLKNTTEYFTFQIIMEDVAEEQDNCSAVKFAVNSGELAIN